jgi:hypothetical protein
MNLLPKKSSGSRLCCSNFIHCMFVSESGFLNTFPAISDFLNDEGGFGNLVTGIKGTSKFLLIIQYNNAQDGVQQR